MAQTIYVNPQTGGYEIQGNKILNAPAAVVKANMLLLQPVGKNPYLPTQGNPLLTRQGLQTKSQVTNDIVACLQPLLNNGSIVTVTVLNYKISALSKPQVTLQIILPSGQDYELTWKP